MDINLSERIEKAVREFMRSEAAGLKMLIGLDGFVDEIIHVVDTRRDFENYTRINEIADFGSRITRASGLSANIEFVPTDTKLGGNGPIFANALLEAGVSVKYVGSVGYPSVHPVFAPMAQKAETFTVCGPGLTDALEFADGKIMLGKHKTLKEITWENVLKAVGGLAKFTAMVADSCLFGMENWTMIPYMSDIWKNIIKDVFPALPDCKDESRKPLAFFDLADPEKRTKEDILEAMKLLSRFEEKFRVILGLNEKEVYEIAEVFDIRLPAALEGAKKLEAVVNAVYRSLDIHCLVVHPTKEAAACTKSGYFQADGPYCKEPKLTTGAGDNFNAGFCLGMALGLEAADSLILGTATSGFYVRNAKSPSRDELVKFLSDWRSGIL